MTKTSPSTEFDMVIVGGGMMGATLALMTHQVLPKCRIALVEAKPYLQNIERTDPNALTSFDGRSTALAPSSVAIFKRLNLWDSLKPYACSIERVHVSDRGNLGLMEITQDDNSGNSLGEVVENWGLGKVLVSEINNHPTIKVLSPCAVRQAKPRRDWVELRCSEVDSDKTSQLNARVLVIADGANSFLRRSLGIAEQVKDYAQAAIVCNVEYSQPHQGVAYERFTRNGPMALLPLSSPNQSALVWTWPDAQADSVMALPDAEFLTKLQSAFGYRLGRFSRVSARALYPLSLRMASEQIRSRIVLMGNAAHFLHPVAGQGFNLALRDAARFLEVLEKRPLEEIGDLSTLQGYEQVQQADQKRTVMLSDAFNNLFRKQWPFAGSLRAKGFLALQLSDELRALFIRQLSGRAHGELRLFASDA